MFSRVRGIMCVCCVIGAGAVGNEIPKHDVLWEMVASSHLILTGTMSVPVETLRAEQNSEKGTYVHIPIAVEERLKGDYTDQTINVQYFTKSHINKGMSPDDLIALNGKQVLLFLILIRGDDPLIKEYYFSGMTNKSCLECTPELIGEVHKEIQRQDTILKDYPHWMARENSSMKRTVKKQIAKVLKNPAQGSDVTNQLIALGLEALPSLVRQMEDFRPLQIKDLMLPNRSSNAFEAFAHYKPKAVVDLVSTIATAITGKGFGHLYNGGSDRERWAAINAWRIYLYEMQHPFTDPGAP